MAPRMRIEIVGRYLFEIGLKSPSTVRHGVIRPARWGLLMMHFGVLGSLEVRDSDGTLIDVGGRRQRQLLAALIIHAGSVVSDDRLTEMVWTESAPPEGGVRALRTVLSRLRTALHDAGADRLILTKPPGHLLERGGFETDAGEFERHVSAGARLLGAGDTQRAIQSIDAGLSLWRGAAYAEFVDDEWARIESTRLEELRAIAHEVRVEAMITSGAHREAIGELEGLVASYPFREQFRLQLITALYRSGRQTEALRHCQNYRDVLAEELGLEPSAAMRELELQILNHAPELAATPAGHPRIKSYELAEKIGAGAWGVVWRPVNRASIATWRSRSSTRTSRTNPSSSSGSKSRPTSWPVSNILTSCRCTTTGAIRPAPTSSLG